MSVPLPIPALARSRTVSSINELAEAPPAGSGPTDAELMAMLDEAVATNAANAADPADDTDDSMPELVPVADRVPLKERTDAKPA